MNAGDTVETLEDSMNWDEGEIATIIEVVDSDFENYPYRIEFGNGRRCWVREQDIRLARD